MGKLQILKEFLVFLKERKLWWMGPIVLFLILMGVLIMISDTAVAPFIYALF